jgi:serine/threonine protein kinase
MGSPRDNFETFFSPGGDDPSQPGPPPPPPEKPKATTEKKESEAAEMRTADVAGDTHSDATQPFGTPEGGDQEFGVTQAVNVTASVPSPELELMRTELINLEIVTDEQWEQARGLAGGSNDLLSILDQLRTLPSHRRSRSEAHPRVITAYQAEEIFEGRAQKLRLGPYLFMSRLGAGGMGEVFKAWNLNLDRIEAIKVVTSNEVTGSTIGLARFEREARVLAQLDHPCITTIYNTGRERGIAFIAMEYVRGKTLLQVVKDAQAKNEKVPADWAVEVMREVASALEHAHTAGVIHRDIKPNNIMITDDGEVRVLDMGIARLLDPDSKASNSNLTRHVAGLGTPEVMPPEQWADASSVSPASDIYSLGCTFFFLLIGKMPFTGESMHSLMSAHLTEAPPAVHQLRKDVSPEVDHVIRKMLAKEPKDRYQSCSELLTDLNQLGGGPVTGRRRRPPVDSGSDRKGLPIVPIASAIVIIVAVLAGIVAYSKYNQPDFNQLRATYVADTLKAHPTAWPRESILEKAADKAGYSTISSQKELEDFKAWLDEQTKAEEKWRVDLTAEATAIQSKHPHIWRSPDEVLDIIKDMPHDSLSAEERNAISAKLTEETGRLIKLHTEAVTEVEHLFEANKDVVSDLEELQSQANRAVPFYSIKEQVDLNTRRKAINEYVRARWDAKIDDALAAEQAKAADVWSNVQAVRAFAGENRLNSISSLAAIDELRQSIAQETWRKKALDWVLKYPETHKDVWGPNTDKLVTFVEEKFPDDILDEATFKQMMDAVNQETSKRSIPAWAKEYQSSHAAIWPSAEDLANVVVKDSAFQSAGAPTKEAFDKAAASLTFDRVFKADLSNGEAPTDDAGKLLLFRQTYLMDLLRVLLSLPAAHKPTGEVTLTIDVDGQAVDSVPLDTFANFSVTSNIPGYVTCIIFESSGKVFAFQWAEPLKAGQKSGLLRLDAVEKGTDRLLVFVTDKSLPSLLVKPPDGIIINAHKIVGRLKDPLEGLLGPAVDKTVQPMVYLETAQVEGIRSALPTRGLFDELRKQLENGTTPDYLPAAKEIKSWGVVKKTVQWGE